MAGKILEIVAVHEERHSKTDQHTDLSPFAAIQEGTPYKTSQRTKESIPFVRNTKYKVQIVQGITPHICRGSVFALTRTITVHGRSSLLPAGGWTFTQTGRSLGSPDQQKVRSHHHVQVDLRR